MPCPFFFSVSWFFVKAGGEIAGNIVIAAAAQKVAENHGPAAGLAVPFVPVILSLPSRRIVNPAYRAVASRYLKKAPTSIDPKLQNSLNEFMEEVGQFHEGKGSRVGAPRPELPLAPRTGGAMSGGYRGAGLTQAEVGAITADFRGSGGVVDQSVDAQRYLQTRGAGGLTLNQETILLPANPTRTTVYEELVHAEQFRRGVTLEAGRGGVLRFEIEAAETLIRNRQAWQLPADEVRQVIENLRNMRAELQRLTAGH